jgi:hypothetical protein
MASNSDEHNKQVLECERMAKNSLSEADRSAWLRLAQQWMRMLRNSRGNETLQADQKDWPPANDQVPVDPIDAAL